MIENTSNRLVWVLGSSIFLLAPSFDTALKYFGPKGVVAYFVIGTILIGSAYRFVWPAFRSSISDKIANYLAIATFLLITAAALYIYPIANSGRLGGGSDADEALITAATDLISGNYPYYRSTYLGNLISPMPGSVLFAIPFVILGAIHLQNVFWLAIFFVVFRHYEKSSVSALGLLWAMLAFSPTLMQNVVTGADYTSNTIFVLVLMWILIRNVSDAEIVGWKRILPAVLLGVALSSRSTFMLLMPLLLSILIQTAGWKNAIKYLTMSGIAFLAVTIPFWVYDPAGFAPLNVQSAKLKAIEDFLPFASIIVPGSAILLSTILSFQTLRLDCARFFWNCAVVQLFVLLLTALIYTLKLGQLDLYLGQTGYGMFTLFFGCRRQLDVFE